MKKLGLLGLALALLVQPVSAQFTPVDAPRAPVDNDRLMYTGNVANPGPYWGKLASPVTGGGYTPYSDQFSIYCVDKHHFVSDGDYWSINATRLDGSENMLQTRVQENSMSVGGNYLTAIDRYRMTVVLAKMYQAPPSGYSFSNIQNAIWHLTSPFYIAGTSALELIDMAWSTYSNIDMNQRGSYFANWYVMTDQTATLATSGDFAGYLQGGKQEYITHVTPEPATVILLFSGLGFIGLAARRRRGAAE